MPLLLSELMRKYFLLSTGRQPDSLAPVWALIGHLTHTHTQRTVLRGSAPPRSAGVWRRSSPLFQGYLLQEPHFPDPMGILITAVFLWAAVGGKHSSHPLNTHTVCMQGAFSVNWRQKIGKLSRRRPSSLHATTSATLFTAMEPALW